MASTSHSTDYGSPRDQAAGRGPSFAVSLLALIGLLLVPTLVPAQPSPIRVGAGGACDHNTILGALFEAAGNTGLDVIHVANDQVYEEFLPVASDSLEIIGGFESCSDSTASGTTQIFAPTSPGQVVATSGSGAAYTLRLENLELYGTSMVARGGVVEINGDYEVMLDNVQISDGLANFGGGVYINGADGAELRTSTSDIVLISENVAVRGGGGIYCTGGATVRFMQGAIANNTANGESTTTQDNAGGGVALHNGCQMLSQAGGFLAGIYGNTLDTVPGIGSAGGGGVAVLSGSLFVAAGSADHPALIADNFSASRGGGVYADGADTQVQLRNSWINAKQAALAGGGLFVSDAGLAMVRTLQGEACHNTHRCSRLHGNSVLEGGQDHGGAIGINSDAFVQIGNTFIEQNSAPTASLAIVRGLSTLQFRNVVAANNAGSDELIRIDNVSEASVEWSTLAYNDLSTAVISIEHGTLAGSIDLRGSIVWQPAIDLVNSDHNATRSGDCVMAADFTGIPELTRTSSGPPGFVAADDLRVTPGGEAVDFCDDASIPTDVDIIGPGRPNDVDLTNEYGPYDLGAYEWRRTFGQLFADRFEEP
jgi:predicted outer membrane repeat protein